MAMQTPGGEKLPQKFMQTLFPHGLFTVLFDRPSERGTTDSLLSFRCVNDDIIIPNSSHLNQKSNEVCTKTRSAYYQPQFRGVKS